MSYLNRRRHAETRGSTWFAQGVVLVSLAFCSTGFAQIRLKLPLTFRVAGSQQAQNNQTNAARLLWTPEAKAVVEARRNQVCSTDTVSQYGDEGIRSALRNFDKEDL